MKFSALAIAALTFWIPVVAPKGIREGSIRKNAASKKNKSRDKNDEFEAKKVKKIQNILRAAAAVNGKNMRGMKPQRKLPEFLETAEGPLEGPAEGLLEALDALGIIDDIDVSGEYDDIGLLDFLINDEADEADLVPTITLDLPVTDELILPLIESRPIDFAVNEIDGNLDPLQVLVLVFGQLLAAVAAPLDFELPFPDDSF